MSSIANFPSPCLVAILLVCNTRNGSGAQILFHYPQSPLSDDTDQSKHRVTPDNGEDESSSDSSASSAEEDDLFALPTEQGVEDFTSKPVTSMKTSTISAGKRTPEYGEPHPEPLFGLEEDGLVSLLTPTRTWHKRRFELGINDLTFIGRPVFVRQDGSWIRRRRTRRVQPKVEHDEADIMSVSEDDSKEDASMPENEAGGEPDVQQTKSPLTMFHVVFVMNPPPLEHALRVKDMYDHVIKKFSRALKWEQVQNDYVWKQTELMLSLRSANFAKKLKNWQLSNEILEKSSLAMAISTVYNAIANSRIASVTLSPKVSISLQIPPITSTAHLPSLTDPPIQPGLWLTTATDMASTVAELEYTSTPSATQLAKHYTLLLKSAPQRIAKDALDAGGPLAITLPKFLTALRPTKSFYKLQLATKMSARDIQLLAQHLIYWRRAIAIPPLYQGDTYIVSPNADLRKLYEATKAYEREFPLTMPSLPKMLSALSGIPRPYGSLIPSTDHKEIYFLALAWLMRHGWVTQLRTFAYIRINPGIKKAVKGIERESRSRMANQQSSNSKYDEGKDNVRSGLKRPSMVSHTSSEGRRVVDVSSMIRNDKVASLILNPPRASPIESKWLAYIGDCLSDENLMHLELSYEERTEIRQYWPAFVKYFNGHVALQTIPIRENLKRKFVWGLLDRLGVNQYGGVEDIQGQNQRLLVTIRHW